MQGCLTQAQASTRSTAFQPRVTFASWLPDSKRLMWNPFSGGLLYEHMKHQRSFPMNLGFNWLCSVSCFVHYHSQKMCYVWTYIPFFWKRVTCPGYRDPNAGLLLVGPQPSDGDFWWWRHIAVKTRVTWSEHDDATSPQSIPVSGDKPWDPLLTVQDAAQKPLPLPYCKAGRKVEDKPISLSQLWGRIMARTVQTNSHPLPW